MFHIALRCALAVLVWAACLGSAFAQNPPAPVINAKAWMLLDVSSGQVLASQNPGERIEPASLTKLMTAYLVFSALRAKTITLEQIVSVSERAWKMGGSRMFIEPKKPVTVAELLRGMIVQSGNDACVALAELVSGSEESFAAAMNREGKRLGMKNTNFKNSTGWPDPDHRMTVREIAMIARRLITDFPEYYKYDAEKTFKYHGIDQPNRNALVQKGVADGLKTGHTDDGGYGLVASAQRGGRRVIVVVNGLPTMRARAEEGERLLEWAFREFENVSLFAAGDVVEQAPVWLGSAPTVPLVAGRDLVITMPRNWRQKAAIAVDYETPMKAPITRGTKLGQLTVRGEGVPEMNVPLLAGADVARLGLPGRAVAVLSHYLTGA